MSTFNGIMERDAFGKITPRSSTYFIQRDVDIIQENARVVVCLEDDKVETRCNEKGHLNVIAVIGNNQLNGSDSAPKQKLLLEIGFWNTRPYKLAKRAKKLRQPGLKTKFWERRKYFSLTPEHYQATAPQIFSLLQKLTDEQCAKWHCNPSNLFYAPSVKHWWSRGKRKLLQCPTYRPRIYGIRFSISRKHPFLLQDIFWAFCNSDETRKILRGFACFIGMRLEKYRNRYTRKFSKLIGAQQIRERAMALKLPPYLIVELLENYLRDGRKNPFWNELYDLFEWNLELPKQLELARNCLPNPYIRVGKTQIRIVKEYKDFVVFEVLPTPTPPAPIEINEPF